jgi:hypothetical protein
MAPSSPPDGRCRGLLPMNTERSLYRPPTNVLASIVLAVVVSLALAAAGVVLYFMLVYLLSWSSLGPVRGFTAFSACSSAFCAPVALVSALFASRHPRWGWLPSLVASSLPFAALAGTTGAARALIVPCSAVLGWGIAALVVVRGATRPRLTAACAGAVCAALFMAVLAGQSDRAWSLRAGAEKARGLGATVTGTPRMDSLEMPFPLRSAVWFRADWRASDRGAAESTLVWLKPTDLHHRRGARINVMRCVDLVDAAPKNPTEARAMALRARVPRSALTQVRWVGAPDPDDPDHVYLAPGDFLAGPRVGTWQHPRIIWHNGTIYVLVGERLT